MKSLSVASMRQPESNEAQNKAQIILRLIASKLAADTKPVLAAYRFHYQLQVIKAQVEREEPIMMVLPAFPAKSANRKKTINYLPDGGELIALKRLNDACEAIRKVYHPGAQILICSDGRVFNDLVQVSDDHVNEYQTSIRNMITEFRFEHLMTYDLDDHFDGLEFHQMRKKLTEDFATPLSEVKAFVKTERSARFLFNGIHRFMTEDLLVLKSQMTKNAIRKMAKSMTYEVIQRSNAWGQLLEQKFPHALRLSIHPQLDRSRKFAVQLVPSASQWRTPWHSVLVTDGQTQMLVRHDQAEAMKGELRLFSGKYPYFFVKDLRQKILQEGE